MFIIQEIFTTVKTYSSINHEKKIVKNNFHLPLTDMYRLNNVKISLLLESIKIHLVLKFLIFV